MKNDTVKKNKFILFFENQGTHNFFTAVKCFFEKIGAWFKYYLLCIVWLFTGKKPAKPFSGKNNTVNKTADASTIVFETDKLIKASNGKNHKGERPAISPDQLASKDYHYSSLFKPRDRRPSFALGVILTTVKIAFLALILTVAVGIGAVFGVANAYLGTSPELDLKQLSDQVLTSYIYDGNGQLITTYAGIENREYASLDEIPKTLKEAVIAVEDVRFYYHNGIDLKRLLGAFISNVSNSSGGGGSTITQQLIKNQLLSSERSYKRKIQEAKLALELETKYSKDQILEAYLNTIPLGGTNYGVKAAAMDYFGKPLDKLTLKENDTEVF
jgi:penicillin-binding protein 1A